MTSFTVPAISCGHCVAQVTQALQGADPKAQVSVDLSTKQVEVDSGVAREVLVAALTDAGYPPA
jgi:copper chaperone